MTVIEIDNPLYNRAHDGDRTNPKRITAAYNPRESYVGWLLARDQINRAEYEAAGKIREAFEAMGGAGARAMDYSKEWVDGGMMPDPITDAQLNAGRTLKQCAAWLGPAGHDLTIKLAGQCLWPKDMAPDRNGQLYVGKRFRECLSTLAHHFGLQKYSTIKAKISA